MKNIDVQKPTVQDLFAGRQYNIDYYQREYKWGRKQVAQLLNDLFSTFKESWEVGDQKEAILDYGGYFLGPVILTNRGFLTDIVDGQQRLTSLALLILALQRRDDVLERDQRRSLRDLVAAENSDGFDFKLAVEERRECMEALLAGREKGIRSDDPSVQNLLHRFDDIEEILANDLEGEAVPRFADWLMRRVQMVSVIATTEDDAYTIFETMNDRGLSLTMPEMMRGYLLSQIKSEQDRSHAADIWKQQVTMLNDLDKDEDKEDVDAIQNWLRARHAVTASQYRKGVEYGDYERIGSEFHRWVRDVAVSRLGLKAAGDFADFIRRDFAFYSQQYARLWRAAEGKDDDLRTVEFIVSQGFTLQNMVILASLSPDDDEDVVLRKMRAVAAYVDILIHRRLWNSMRIGQTSLRYQLFDLAKRIRGVGPDQLAEILSDNLADGALDFRLDRAFGLKQRNSNIVRRFLARLTLYVDHGRAGSDPYARLLKTGTKGYDIEHILADAPALHVRDYPDERDFWDERNWIGGLLLIPSSVNRSFGDLEYERKREHYLKENSLAASLHEESYQYNPELRSFLEQTNLPLRPYDHFGKTELRERQDLYEQIASQVWSPERIAREAGL